MTYKQCKSNIKRRFVVHDGYTGKQTTLGLAFVDGCAVAVADCGCFRFNAYRYADEVSMLYYFDNHASVHFPALLRKIA